MIIADKTTGENIYIEIFKVINQAFKKLGYLHKKTKGRPRKYTDQQIVACLVYQVKNNIFSLRELEWKIKQDIHFQSIIGLEEVPDYSTLSIRLNELEKRAFYGLYNMVIFLINPSLRLCAIDSTALRSSRYDREARYGKGTRVGNYKGYKLHCAAAVDDYVVPLVFELTTANVYDNQLVELLYEVKIFNPFLTLADAAYDDENWFATAKSLDLHLLTDINMRRAESIESFTSQERYENAVHMESPIGQKHYKKRISIEQLFSILKGLYNLENPRLYGMRRYQRHIRWVLFTYLVDEAIKKQQGIFNRKYPWNR